MGNSTEDHGGMNVRAGGREGTLPNGVLWIHNHSIHDCIVVAVTYIGSVDALAKSLHNIDEVEKVGGV